MGAIAHRSDNKNLPVMLAVALILHGLGLLVVLPDLATTQKPEPKTLRLFRPLVEQKNQDSTAPVQAAAAPTHPASTATETVQEQDLRESLEVASKPSPSAESSASPSAVNLIEQTLLQAEKSVSLQSSERSILDGRPVPRLPGSQGWLNAFVGSVRPEQTSWLEADGATSARVVSSSGEIYCGHKRAATAAEEFNPWMSAALMLWKSCGRRRPEPVDPQDPWQRGGGVLP
jgi:hypothetical protein